MYKRRLVWVGLEKDRPIAQGWTGRAATSTVTSLNLWEALLLGLHQKHLLGNGLPPGGSEPNMVATVGAAQPDSFPMTETVRVKE